MKNNQSKNTIDSLKNNKKLRMFLLFLTLSFLFWMLIKLSEEYIADVKLMVNYIDLPNNKLLQKEPLKEITLTLKATGFNVLKRRIKEKTIDYSLKDVKHLKQNIYYSLTNSNLKYIQAQFSAEMNLLKIKPDTLYFDFGKKSSKKVKVKTAIKLQFKSGYDLVTPIKISPEFVTISGPKGILDSIEEVKTKAIVIEDVADSLKKNIPLIIPNKKIVLSKENILLTAKVDKFTEGTFTMPFEVINVPKNSIISTYPKEVEIVFKVALSNYKNVVPDSFKIICDFNETKQNNLEYLIPKIIDQPKIVKSAKIVPNKIEYLIKSKD